MDYNPYEGREVTGVTDTVLSRGRVIIDGGKFTGRAGAGAFLAAQRHGRQTPGSIVAHASRTRVGPGDPSGCSPPALLVAHLAADGIAARRPRQAPADAGGGSRATRTRIR